MPNQVLEAGKPERCYYGEWFSLGQERGDGKAVRLLEGGPLGTSISSSFSLPPSGSTPKENFLFAPFTAYLGFGARNEGNY